MVLLKMGPMGPRGLGLISSNNAHVEEYMAAVEKKGLDYGLQIHWGKVHLISVGSEAPVRTPAGDTIPTAESLLYLGSTIHRNGKFGSEISRKIGAAKATFRTLSNVWKNSQLPMRRRLALFDSLILSGLRYGVASAWLSKSDLRRMDGFHAGCLRKMLKIPVAYISRISNEEVRRRVQQQPLSVSIRAMQLKLLGQVLTNPDKDFLKDAAFQDGDVLRPSTAAYVRKVGRPRDNWAEKLIAIVRPATGTLRRWLQVTSSEQLWNETVANLLEH